MEDNSSMKSRAVLVLVAWMAGAAGGVQARAAHYPVLAIHGRGDYYPRQPFAITHAPWSMSWRVNCSGARQKFALFHVQHWPTHRVVDLIRVEATGQRPTRYTEPRDRTGRLNHWLIAFGNDGMRRERLPAGKYIITVHTACRWSLWVASS